MSSETGPGLEGPMTGFDRAETRPSATWMTQELARLDAALEAFRAAMKDRLATKIVEGRTGWDDPALARKFYVDFLAHVAGIDLAAGEEVDAANFLMFLWWQRTRGNR